MKKIILLFLLSISLFAQVKWESLPVDTFAHEYDYVLVGKLHPDALKGTPAHNLKEITSYKMNFEDFIVAHTYVVDDDVLHIGTLSVVLLLIGWNVRNTIKIRKLCKK